MHFAPTTGSKTADKGARPLRLAQQCGGFAYSKLCLSSPLDNEWLSKCLLSA